MNEPLKTEVRFAMFPETLKGEQDYQRAKEIFDITENMRRNTKDFNIERKTETKVARNLLKTILDNLKGVGDAFAIR